MPQTGAQLQHLQVRGVATVVMDTSHFFEPQERAAQIAHAVDAALHEMRAGRDVVLQAPNDPAQVARMRAGGAQRGLSATETARLVSQSLAEAAAQIAARSGQNRLVVAGGETSAAVCERLGVRGLRIWKEIQPGLPSCVSLSADPLLLVFKSGSFGSPDFLERALEHLKAQ